MSLPSYAPPTSHLRRTEYRTAEGRTGIGYAGTKLRAAMADWSLYSAI